MSSSWRTLFSRNASLLLFWAFSASFVFFLLWLCQLPLFPAGLYGAVSFVAILFLTASDAHRLRREKRLLKMEDYSSDQFPSSAKPYLEAIEDRVQETRELTTKSAGEKRELQDYFSLWAHEIKLPLAALKLLLDTPEPDLNACRESTERMERSVDMAMAYIRTESSDYRFEKTSLETLARKQIRQNAGLFISRKIQVDLVVCSDSSVITDTKWMSYVIEQLFSNALKYSPDAGIIRILCDGRTLSILDEGCGIDAQDLPRIYEKGFTGRNGRKHQHASSGLGLYLSSRICQRLGAELSVVNRDDGPGVKASVHLKEQPALFD